MKMWVEHTLEGEEDAREVGSGVHMECGYMQYMSVCKAYCNRDIHAVYIIYI